MQCPGHLAALVLNNYTICGAVKASLHRFLFVLVPGPHGQVATHKLLLTQQSSALAALQPPAAPAADTPSDTHLQEMQPVICVTDGNVRHGVVYSVDESKLQMLVAVSVAQQLPTPQFGSQETLRPYK